LLSTRIVYKQGYILYYYI